MRHSNSGSQASVPAVSTLVSRNVTVDGHRTSVRLEPAMWTALQEICRRERSSLHETCTMIAMQRVGESSLTAAVRVFIMAYYRAAATDDGHRRAGHGSCTADGLLATLPGVKPLSVVNMARRS
ncbi:MAG: ribbon-helix-helix domain-containing protein [Alphaproteobacteria bacterium]|nr:ribbon-helix-helix domain-containing protein [Alphaproteobacteria bacterium]